MSQLLSFSKNTNHYSDGVYSSVKRTAALAKATVPLNSCCKITVPLQRKLQINMPRKFTIHPKAEVFVLFIFIANFIIFIQTANAENRVIKAPCIFDKESRACVPVRKIKNQAVHQRRQERCNQKTVICVEQNLCICANKGTLTLLKRILI